MEALDKKDLEEFLAQMETQARERLIRGDGSENDHAAGMIDMIGYIAQYIKTESEEPEEAPDQEDSAEEAPDQEDSAEDETEDQLELPAIK